jgi:hypothetical protein
MRCWDAIPDRYCQSSASLSDGQGFAILADWHSTRLGDCLGLKMMSVCSCSQLAIQAVGSILKAGRFMIFILIPIIMIVINNIIIMIMIIEII